jgi:2-polyprenyl-3-methyl-5-hydroxy-6-metoxy-1,4-benzoquinol methylase
MDTKHLQSELNFYQKAFLHNAGRRKHGYGWESEPSRVVKDIIIKNKLNADAKNKQMLDLGCGDGRHITLFRQMGFSITGVDFSKEAIKLCKEKFKNDKKVKLYRIDLTKKNGLKNLGKFDLILDWSVLDHIRRKYFKTYLSNIKGAIKPGGFGIFAEFDASLPGLFKNKDYKIVHGHYSRAYTIPTLLETLKPLRMIDCRKAILEDEINNYKFNTVLMKQI